MRSRTASEPGLTNVAQLAIEFTAIEIIPPGTPHPTATALNTLSRPGGIEKAAAAGKLKAAEAISRVRVALEAEGMRKTDEEIAGLVLERLDARRRARAVK